MFVTFESAGVAATNAISALKLAEKLDSLKGRIANDITAELMRTNFSGSYTVVWRAYEDAAIQGLEKVLVKYIPELESKNFDAGKNGREKNRLADLAIVLGAEQIEISIKVARNSENPENDMGTFRDHPNRKRLFIASYTLWVRYSDLGKTITCDSAFFDRTWRFVGKSTLVNGVKYRKKDGNMRPKPWSMFDSGASFWKTEGEFEAAVKRSEDFRANEIVKEYLSELNEADQRVLFEKLKEKFSTTH